MFWKWKLCCVCDCVAIAPPKIANFLELNSLKKPDWQYCIGFKNRQKVLNHSTLTYSDGKFTIWELIYSYSYSIILSLHCHYTVHILIATNLIISHINYCTMRYKILWHNGYNTKWSRICLTNFVGGLQKVFENNTCT